MHNHWSHRLVYPKPTLSAAAQAPLDLKAVLFVPHEFEAAIDDIIRVEDSVFGVASGDAMKRAIDAACRTTFSSVREVESLDEATGADLVVVPLGVQMRGNDDDDAGRSIDLRVAVAVSIRGSPPKRFEYSEREPISGAQAFFGSYTAGPTLDNVPRQLVERAATRFRSELLAAAVGVTGRSPTDGER